MHSLPKRHSLLQETVVVMQDQIRRGLYGEFLPGERALAERLQIGRNTLRLALQVLEDEKWISPSIQGRRRKILISGNKKSSDKGPLKQVYYLTDLDLGDFAAHNLLYLDLLRKDLAERDCRMDVLSNPFGSNASLENQLRRRVTSSAPGVWVLSSCAPAVHEWFIKNNIPAVSLGYAEEESGLPFVALNLEAAAQHLCGTLRRLQHRRVALLLPESPLLAHRILERSLQVGLVTSPQEADTLRYISHDGSPGRIVHQLERCFRQKDAPTAIVTLNLRELMTTVTALMNMGLRIPTDVSVVCMVGDPIYKIMVPEISCYDIPSKTVVKKVREKIFSAWELGPKQTRSHRIMCTFVKGQSLGQAPQA